MCWLSVYVSMKQAQYSTENMAVSSGDEYDVKLKKIEYDIKINQFIGT